MTRPGPRRRLATETTTLALQSVAEFSLAIRTDQSEPSCVRMHRRFKAPPGRIPVAAPGGRAAAPEPADVPSLHHGPGGSRYRRCRPGRHPARATADCRPARGCAVPDQGWPARGGTGRRGPADLAHDGEAASGLSCVRRRRVWRRSTSRLRAAPVARQPRPAHVTPGPPGASEPPAAAARGRRGGARLLERSRPAARRSWPRR